MTKNLQYESGRSMVEMLGTLAIIGVLSVGGIAGYSYGMDKYRANRTMYDVNVRAIDVLAQFDATGDATLDGWKNEKTLYPITLEDETIGIQVSGVPSRVCELMVEGMEKHAKAVKINAEYVGENAGDCGNENTLVFYFDEDEESGGRVEKCGDIVCEQCQTCDTSTNTCVAVPDGMSPSDMPTCTNGEYKSYCVGGVCLADGSKECGGDPECTFYDGECVLVDSGEYMLLGIGGFSCTKNGQNGYCMNGICQPLGDPTKCAGDEECVTNLNGECIMQGALEGILYGYSIPCTKNGQKGTCISGICTPSEDTSDCGTYPECYEKYDDQCIPLTTQCLAGSIKNMYGCTTTDGQEGACVGGTCIKDIECECSSNSDCDSGEFCETIRSVTWNWSYIQHNYTKCSDPECVEHTVSYTDENGKEVSKKIYRCKKMSPVANNHSRVCSFIGKSPLDKDELFVDYRSWWTEEPLTPTALGATVGSIVDGCWMEDWGYAFYDETTKEFRGGEQSGWDDQGCYLCW